MAISLSTVHESMNALKKAAEPWSKEVKDAVDKISAGATTLLRATCPSVQATERATALLRHSFNSLYGTFPTASLQLSAAIFSAIVGEKVSGAIKKKAQEEKIRWETIATAILDGVQDHIETNPNEQVKRAVAQAFYANTCDMFFSSTHSVIPSGHSVLLRVAVYLLLSSTAEGCSANKDKLRNDKLLGGKRLGCVIAMTKDYLALEEVLTLFARLLPPAKGRGSDGRSVRKRFLEDCFVNTPGFMHGKDIFKLVDTIASADWEAVSIKVVDILARDITV
ncbi:hypothetical protein FA95DRAFT_707072 [Auriscalpium vulgare]|uniref:Uncharacterized protein n=1 Tax=Auriscalpium vulgare TaxID=40419 RepID=A0ACB8S0I2_9AGAM|nr:hypothetical protein FA95DRAFT_707072 [Auriscalpium vulgare]